MSISLRQLFFPQVATDTRSSCPISEWQPSCEAAGQFPSGCPVSFMNPAVERLPGCLVSKWCPSREAAVQFLCGNPAARPPEPKFHLIFPLHKCNTRIATAHRTQLRPHFLHKQASSHPPSTPPTARDFVGQSFSSLLLEFVFASLQFECRKSHFLEIWG